MTTEPEFTTLKARDLKPYHECGACGFAHERNFEPLEDS